MADREATVHDHSIAKIFHRLGETGTTSEALGLFAAIEARRQDQTAH